MVEDYVVGSGEVAVGSSIVVMATWNRRRTATWVQSKTNVPVYATLVDSCEGRDFADFSLGKKNEKDEQE